MVSKPSLKNVLLDVWFESFKAWRLPHAPRAVHFVRITVYRIYVRVLLIVPTVPERDLPLLVTQFRCFCRRLAFRTENGELCFTIVQQLSLV
jgi:hypothetical protein